MYRLATSVLYKELVVQNVGLLLMGIQEPRPTVAENVSTGHNAGNDSSDADQSVPYHKSVLLDKIEKVHIVLASSRVPVEEPYMVVVGASPRRLDRLESHKADRLGTLDLDGWILAGSLVDIVASRSMGHTDNISFARLQILTSGMWDDGRWTVYSKFEYGERNNGGQPALPLSALWTIRNRIFYPAANSHSVDMCYNAGYDGATSEYDLKVPLNHLTGLTTIHAFDAFRRSLDHLLGRTRVFYTVKTYLRMTCSLLTTNKIS